MPNVSTQNAIYIKNLYKTRIENLKNQKVAEKKIKEAVVKLIERKKFLKKSINVEVGFCFKHNSDKVSNVFVSWFDHALETRVGLGYNSKLGTFTIPVSSFIQKYKTIEYFKAEVDFLPGITALKQSLQNTKNYTDSIKQMITASNRNVPDYIKDLNGLFYWIKCCCYFSRIEK